MEWFDALRTMCSLLSEMCVFESGLLGQLRVLESAMWLFGGIDAALKKYDEAGLLGSLLN